LSSALDIPAEKIRAFVAVRIPPAVIEQLTALQQQLRLEFPDVQWTRPESMHITLHFFGNVKTRRLPELNNALRTAAHEHILFEIQPRGLGSFAQRVLWVGIQRGERELTKLAESVHRACRGFGAKEETRSFNPHVTLGRFRVRGRGVDAALRKIPAPEFQPWRVDHIELIRSELSTRGSHYTTLGELSLCSERGSADGMSDVRR
jgi:2'-5' RNA ligase